MTVGEAKRLTSVLVAAHPTTIVKAPTVSLWIFELRPLDFELAEEALLSLIRSLRFFPSLAEFHEQVSVVRGRRHKAAVEKEWADYEAEYEKLELPTEENKQRALAMIAMLNAMHAMEKQREPEPAFTEPEP